MAEGFPRGNMLAGSRVIVSAWSSRIRLVTALRRVSLVWVSVPLLQLNLPCHYCSRAACLPACLPAALSLDGRCEAASSVSSQGWLKCGQVSEAECHDSSKGNVCVPVCVLWSTTKHVLNWWKATGNIKEAMVIMTAKKCKHEANLNASEWETIFLLVKLDHTFTTYNHIYL